MKSTADLSTTLRSPGFPVELGGVDALLAAFLNESSTRGFVQRRAAGNPGPVEMTSLFGYIGKKTFPRWVRGTADPSASLGMTKGRMALPFRFDAADDEQQVPPLRFASVGMTLLFGWVHQFSFLG
jgi:hypothetical protein